MAHRGEAQEFLKYFSMKQDSEYSNLYSNSDLFLLISGEGPFEVLTKLPYVLGKFEITSIVNIGIAGSLCQQVKKGEIYEIRTVYAFSNNKPRFESFTGKTDSLLDCITTEDRVLSTKFAMELAPFANIIDREAWAITKVAKEFRKPVTIYKLISDIAGDETSCFDLKERAKEFSASMLDYFLKKNFDKETPTIDEKRISFPFHISFTQKKRAEKLFNKLSTVSEDLFTEFLNLDSTHDLQRKEIPNSFISFLENKINPINQVIEEKFNCELKSIRDCGAKVIYDKKLDSKKVAIHFEINSQANIEKMKLALSNTKFENIEKIWKGNFNV
jgi:hypothetical protein